MAPEQARGDGAALGPREETLPVDDFTGILLRRVGGQSHPEHPNLVGTYWMVLLDGDRQIQLASYRHDEATRVAVQLSEAMGLPLVGNEGPVASG